MLPSACLDGVGTSDDSDYRAQYPAYACPCHRSTPSLAADAEWLRVGVVRYTFPVRLFHPLCSSRLLALSETRFPLAGYASAVRNSPSGFMRLRLVRSHRSSSVCELASQSRGGGVSTNAPHMSSQPNSIDDRVVLVTEANGSLTKSTSGGRLMATQNARPLFATIGNAG